jgi:hypothetical protein
MHQQDRAALGIELPMAPEDETLDAEKICSNLTAEIRTTNLVRVDMIPIDLVRCTRWILFSNMCYILVFVYISVHHKLSCGLHDGTEVTRLDTPWWVPVCPLGRRFVDEVDVFPLGIPS